MKFSKNLLFAFLLVFLPAIAFAGGKKSGIQSKDISFSAPIQVGTQQLKAGDYRVQWNGTADNTEVAFVQNGKEVASVPARLVQSSNQSNASFETNTTTNVPTLQRVYVKNGVLEFDGLPNAKSAPSTPSEPTGSQ